MPMIHDVACTNEISEPMGFGGLKTRGQMLYVLFPCEKSAKAFASHDKSRVYNYRFWDPTILAGSLIVDRRGLNHDSF